MSKIYTSYFARIKDLPDNIVPISICGKAPEGYKGLQYKTLAPKWGFFKLWKDTHDNDMFTKEYYNQVLNKIFVTNVVRELLEMIDYDINKDICLVCYEKPDDFCHRHLVAKWLIYHGFNCEEFDFGDS